MTDLASGQTLENHTLEAAHDMVYEAPPKYCSYCGSKMWVKDLVVTVSVFRAQELYRHVTVEVDVLGSPSLTARLCGRKAILNFNSRVYQCSFVV